ADDPIRAFVKRMVPSAFAPEPKPAVKKPVPKKAKPKPKKHHKKKHTGR
ncbi:MAG: hypothetical protein QOF12_730, partial [Solirubrobacteraceae bacterium]|nr:hypothetical protein [Solirubrobacteraceae bacterium]